MAPAAAHMPALVAVKWQSVLAASPFAISGALETFIGLAVVVVLLRLEFHRRALATTETSVGGSRHGKGYVESFKQVLCQCAPEALGLFFCVGLTSVILAYGDRSEVSEDQREHWEAIKREWPLLTCADTLLSLMLLLQAGMLLSSVLRSNDAGPAPMGDETAVLYLGGCVARVICTLRSASYNLDGPMGGVLPAAFNGVSLMCALLIGRKALFRHPLIAITTAAGVAWLSCRHCFLLSEGDQVADATFIAPCLFDGLAAFMYLSRSLLIEAPLCFSSFARHVVMSLQAGLGAYYFFGTDHLDHPDFIGAGHPYKLLQVSHAATSAAYVGAAVMFLSELSLGSDVSAAQ